MRKNRILYLIQYPPPLHGVSYINKMVYESEKIHEGYQKKRIQMNLFGEIESVNSLNIKKLIHFICVGFKLIFNLLFWRPHIVYFSIVPMGKAFFRDVFFCFFIRISGSKVVYHLHQQGIKNFIGNKTWLKKLYEWIFSHSNIIHLSNGLMEREIKWLKLKNSQLFVLENGIMDHTFEIEKSIESKNIVFLSHLQESKGVLILLEAFAKFIEIHPEYQLILVGSPNPPEMADKIGQKLIELAIVDSVSLLGPLFGSEKFKVLQSAYMFVLPTLFDAFPLVILEAFQCGLAVIASDEGAIPEMIMDGKDGILITKNDAQALFQAMCELSENEYIMNMLKTNAYNTYLQRFTQERFECQMRNILLKL